jgi:undecaprenyl-diphosphatase
MRFLRARIEPGAATGLGLTLAVVGIVVGGTLLGGLAFLVRTSDSGLVGLDRSAAVWGAEQATSATTFVVRAVTQLGGTLLIVPMAVVLTVVEYRRLPHRSLPLFVLLIVVGQLVIVNLIKIAVARIRPDIDPLASFSGASFPSGHTTAAASFAAAAALVLGRSRPLRVRAILAGAAVGAAVAVAASRVLLGVHWFSDVLAGLALGWSWFAILAIAFGGRLMRFGAPVEAAQAAAGSETGAPDPRPSQQGRAVSSGSVQGYAVRDRRARSV